MTLSSLRKKLVDDSACQEFEKSGTGSTIPRESLLDLFLPPAALLGLDQLHAPDFLAKDLTDCALGKIVREFHVIWGLVLHRVRFPVSDRLIGVAFTPGFRTTKALNLWPEYASATPLTQYSRIFGCANRTSSASLG
jgi:hypothetical protein